MSNLIIEKEPISSFNDLREGDAIIGFNKWVLFRIRSNLHKHFNNSEDHQAALIYGALPPRSKKLQATLFNNREKYKYLIATDAIGMGLNLNIQRIIIISFHKNTKNKFNVEILP